MHKQIFYRTLLLLMICGIIIEGCTPVPIKTIYKLSRIDMMTVDPAILRAAIRIPDTLAPRDETAKLSITMKVEGSRTISEEFFLKNISSPEELLPMQTNQQKGYSIWVYQVNPKDLSRLEQYQNKAKSLKSTYGRKAKGSVSVSVGACHRNGVPEGALLLSNWLRIDKTSGYLRTVTDYDLKDAIASGNEGDLPPC